MVIDSTGPKKKVHSGIGRGTTIEGTPRYPYMALISLFQKYNKIFEFLGMWHLYLIENQILGGVIFMHFFDTRPLIA